MIEKGRKTEEEIEKRIMWESIYQKGAEISGK